jgi:hypothetical protein
MCTLECPRCGQAGPGDRDESAFDFLDRDELLALRRCRRCGTVLLVRFTLFPTEAHAEVIPADVWEAMEEARSIARVSSMTSPAPPS